MPVILTLKEDGIQDQVTPKIATTDTLLILGKFNTSPGKIGYPKSYVPKLTQQFVEEYIELYNNKVPTKELKDSWNKEEIIALFTKYGEDKRVA
jgi:hypothetical protein